MNVVILVYLELERKNDHSIIQTQWCTMIGYKFTKSYDKISTFFGRMIIKKNGRWLVLYICNVKQYKRTFMCLLFFNLLNANAFIYWLLTKRSNKTKLIKTIEKEMCL